MVTSVECTTVVAMLLGGKKKNGKYLFMRANHVVCIHFNLPADPISTPSPFPSPFSSSLLPLSLSSIEVNVTLGMDRSQLDCRNYTSMVPFFLAGPPQLTPEDLTVLEKSSEEIQIARPTVNDIVTKLPANNSP